MRTTVARSRALPMNSTPAPELRQVALAYVALALHPLEVDQRHALPFRETLHRHLFTGIVP